VPLLPRSGFVQSALVNQNGRLGDKVTFNYGIDYDGQRWWWCDQYLAGKKHGPFRTEAECERHSEVTVFGPKCKFTDGGQWDPAWDRKQISRSEKSEGRDPGWSRPSFHDEEKATPNEKERTKSNRLP
jgi:hypothetical protein